MELRHIRYFLVVAEERHFTRAAAKVGIGQPPLSQQIKDLEREVGAALFHRLAHGAELTEAGKAFLPAVKEMPLIAERAPAAARRAARSARLILNSMRLRFRLRQVQQMKGAHFPPVFTTTGRLSLVGEPGKGNTHGRAAH